MERQMRWQRNSEGDLKLYVKDTGDWTFYKNHMFYRPDHTTSSHSGFATAQRLLGAGYSFLPTEGDN